LVSCTSACARDREHRWAVDTPQRSNTKHQNGCHATACVRPVLLVCVRRIGRTQCRRDPRRHRQCSSRYNYRAILLMCRPVTRNTKPTLSACAREASWWRKPCGKPELVVQRLGSTAMHATRNFHDTAVLPKIPHSNCCKRVSNRPLRGRRGRFGTLLQQLECGIFGRTAVFLRTTPGALLAPYLFDHLPRARSAGASVCTVFGGGGEPRALMAPPLTLPCSSARPQRNCRR